MREKSTIFIAGIASIAIYIGMVVLLSHYFNDYKKKKNVHYVQKSEEAMVVTLATPKSLHQPSVTPKTLSKPKPKPKISKSKSKPKQQEHKKILKEKIVPKKSLKKVEQNLTKVKKRERPKNLFASVSSHNKPKLNMIITDKPIAPKKSNLIQLFDTPSAQSLVAQSLNQKQNRQSGVEESYLAKVQNLLEGWPAQSDYAGEKVKVMLFIEPTGFFEFKLTSISNNPRFNRGLERYLEQLQEFGFGQHKGERTYRFEAEFIAKE